MDQLSQEVVVVRIYLHEADHGRRKNLMQEILGALRDQYGVRGVTVFRAIAGMGDTGETHAADILRLAVDLPIVIEFFDSADVVDAVTRSMAEMLAGHPIVSWSARERSIPAERA
jgi:PII-like signaling protein